MDSAGGYRERDRAIRCALGHLIVGRYDTHVYPTALWQVGEVVHFDRLSSRPYIIQSQLNRSVPILGSCATTLREYMTVQSDNGAVQLSIPALKDVCTFIILPYWVRTMQQSDIGLFRWLAAAGFEKLR